MIDFKDRSFRTGAVITGFVLIVLLIFTKRKKFDGQIFLMYLIGYGLGRFWIEGLRTDQLKIGHTDIAVSQLLSAVIVSGAFVMLSVP